MRSKTQILAVAFTLLAMLAVPLSVLAAGNAFPEVIPLPVGFRPEGIVVGNGHTFYTGSLANGAIYRGDLRTGEGEVIFPGQEGRVAVGMTFDKRGGNLFVAGGPTGQAYVYDADSGEELAIYSLGAGFINDAIFTPQAVYFTNSFAEEYYRLPFGKGGALPSQADVQTIPLNGDWQQIAGFNANGIEATKNGKSLIIVHSSLGQLYRIEPMTGEATLIDLGGDSVLAGDGLVFKFSSLFVVQNQFNQIAEVKLDSNLASGEIVRTLTSPYFDVPTTAAAFGKALYAVNARFGNPDPNNAEYDVVRVSLR